MKRLLTMALLFTGLLAMAEYGKGKLLYDMDFHSPEEFRKWSGKSDRMIENGALHIRGNQILVRKIDPALIRGTVWIEAEMKVERIPNPEKPYWGAKAMLVIEEPNGRKSYPEPAGIPRYGTTGWKTCNLLLKIPEQVKSIQLWMGIQNATGDYWLRRFQIYQAVEEKESAAMQYKMPDTAAIPRGDCKGAKYRGFMSGNDFSEEAFQQLAAWKANLLRYQMQPGKRDISDRRKYLEWIDAEIEKIDQLLPLCKKYGIKLVIDLHRGPAGSRKNEVSSNVITDPGEVIAPLEQAWRKLAGHYRNNPLIYGYDILNEPQASGIIPGELHPWFTISRKIVKAIREVDPATPIIVEADLENWRKFQKIDDPNIIYSTHTYAPVDYTHQGVLKATPFTWSYPGVIQGEYWNKEKLREDLKDVILFQKKYQVPIYIGEFSVISWAEGADQYLKDLIELFEEYGWDWTFHAYREFPGWSIEHESPRRGSFRKSADNPRKRVLLDALKKNGKGGE